MRGKVAIVVLVAANTERKKNHLKVEVTHKVLEVMNTDTRVEESLG